MKKHGPLLVFISAVLFGLNPLISKSIYLYGGTPVTLVFFRLLFGSVGMITLNYFLLGDNLTVNLVEFKELLICAQFSTVTPLLLWSSYKYIPSGLSTTINFSYPTLVLIGSFIVYHQRVSRKQTVSCIISLIGIACFCQLDGKIDFKGIILALLSAVTFAANILYLANSGLTRLSPYKLNFWLSICGAVEVLAVGLLNSKFTLKIEPIGWGLIMLLGLSTGVIASTAFQQGIKFIGAQKASLLSTFEPLTSIVVGAVIYSEVISFQTAIGIMLILSSVLLLTVSPAGLLSKTNKYI